MKKVTIMLSAMAVLAVVGGALALKSTKHSAVAFCSTTASPAGSCDIPLECYTVDPNGNFITTYYCTTALDQPCPTISPLDRDC